MLWLTMTMVMPFSARRSSVFWTSRVDGQRARRFVEDDDVRVERQRTSDGDELALAAGEELDFGLEVDVLPQLVHHDAL